MENTITTTTTTTPQKKQERGSNCRLCRQTRDCSPSFWALIHSLKKYGRRALRRLFCSPLLQKISKYGPWSTRKAVRMMLRLYARQAQKRGARARNPSFGESLALRSTTPCYAGSLRPLCTQGEVVITVRTPPAFPGSSRVRCLCLFSSGVAVSLGCGSCV